MILASEGWSRRRRSAAARSRIADEGDRSEHCYILLDGVLIQEKLIDRGRRQIVGLHVPGDMCGLSALSGDPSTHDLVALSPVSYLSVRCQWLSSLARESRDLLEAVWREMSREAAISAAWIANIGQRPAYERLAHLICEIDARLRTSGYNTNDGFKWRGTQADFGAATGLSVVHVNKTLRKLEADRLVSCGRYIKVHDAEKLSVVGGFDPAYLALDRESLGGMLLSRIDELNAAQSDERDLRPFYAPAHPATAAFG